ncbi:hypothetical protein [Saccharopolyspora sp. ASAGF58]|uniref:hypothetical protein n=1 Tax=Saccharopolyspora sp. ASAGF58 TaxID=2719023 RepID=UPI0014483DA4|nr:hypothetical protein [Saccharopolyspora sp. ASAGF58]
MLGGFVQEGRAANIGHILVEGPHAVILNADFQAPAPGGDDSRVPQFPLKSKVRFPLKSKELSTTSGVSGADTPVDRSFNGNCGEEVTGERRPPPST